MSAHEALGQQFPKAHPTGPIKTNERYMTIHEIKGLQTGDFMTGTKVGDLHRNWPGYGGYGWGELHHDIANRGMAPVTVTRDKGDKPRALVNGHHRSVVAMESGMMFVPVSEEWGESGRGEKNYHNIGLLNKLQGNPKPPLWESERPPKPPAHTQPVHFAQEQFDV